MRRSQLNDWYKSFLEDRDLLKPTGEDLYSYKMTKDEFENLEKYLIAWLSDPAILFRRDIILNELVEDHLFNQLFVQYASEWWKRRYQGGSWSWDPILQDLHLVQSHWYPSKRNYCVEDGFRQWGLPLKNKNGKRFLGSVAIQGGLPMKLMTKNQGSVIRVLHRVLDLTANAAFDFDLVLSWVSSLSSYLPQTYQKKEVYELLSKVVIVLTDLKLEAESDSPDVLMRLWNDNTSSWKRKFPISINDKITERLIENLISKVAQVKRKKELEQVVSSERILVLHSDGQYELHTNITLCKSISREQLTEAFDNLDPSNISPQLKLEIQCGNQSILIQLRKVLGDSSYSFSDTVIPGFHNSMAENEITLTLRDKHGNSWAGKSSLADQLDIDNPWIFTLNNEGEYTYVGQGTCNVAATSFAAVLPEEVEIKRPDDRVLLGNVNKKFPIYKIDSIAVFKNKSADYFRVKTGYAGEINKIQLNGRQLTDLFKRPSKAFRGIPKLVKLGELQNITTIEFACKIGGRVYPSSNTIARGPSRAFIASEGVVFWKSKLLILPEDSSEQIIKGNSVYQGVWHFKNWGIETLRCLTTEIDVIKNDHDQWLFTYTGDKNIPEQLTVEVLWKGNPDKAVIHVPFPGVGVYSFDRQSNPVSSGQNVAISDMNGMRIYIIPGSNRIVKILLESEMRSRSINTISLNNQHHTILIRMIDFKEEIEETLYLSNELDSIVNFKIIFGDREEYSMAISRYSFKPKKKDGNWYLPENILSTISETESKQLRLYAQPLDQPGEVPQEVPHNGTGSLELPKEMITVSPTLLYSGKNSDYFMRPTLLSSADDEHKLSNGENGLSGAIQIFDNNVRKLALQEAIQKLSEDPEHKDWMLVEGYASEFNHLPLSTFDLWKESIKNTDFMAALITKSQSFENGFMDQFEIELPFMYQFIPIKSYKLALQKCIDDLHNAGISKKDIYSLLRDRHSVSAYRFQFFKYSYLLALSELLGERDPILNYFLKKPTDAEKFLFEDHQSECQKLRQRQKNNDWHTYKELYVLLKKYSSDCKNLLREMDNFRAITINIPRLLAYLAFSNIEEILLKDLEIIMLIRDLRNFDEEWFKYAFNLTLIQLYAEAQNE